jgi:hypothetical protein
VGFFGELFEELGGEITGLLSPGRWVTLKNGKRVKLDADGRIVAGLPSKYQGVHVADFAAVASEERELLGIDCEELAACHGCVKSFTSKDQAFRALLAANPDLDALRSSEFGAYDVAWLRWRRNGGRGPKPRTTITDGRLDAINEHFNLKGANRVGSITEAIYYAIPTSRRWKDLGPRLAQLEELAGFRLNLPTEALRVEASGLDVEACRQDVDRRLAELLEKARAGRAKKPGELEDAPF